MAENQKSMIPVKQAAALLMVTEQWVRELGRKGYIPKAVDGQVPTVDAVQGYIRWLKDEERRTSKTASASKVQEERALEIRMRREREAGNLIDIQSIEAVAADAFGAFRSELAGVPAAATRDLELRGSIEKALNDALDRVRANFEKQVAALQETDSGYVGDETPVS